MKSIKKLIAMIMVLLMIVSIMGPLKMTVLAEIKSEETVIEETVIEGETEPESETESEPESEPETNTETAAGTNPDLEISAPSAILMEASTGTIIYEKDASVALRPASITKIMTLLLIFDALEAGKIKLEDTVTVSEYAASMGGSQVFLEAGEQQTVETMIKCISVASANDASVAMAEHIFGSEAEFVNQMNSRAAGLGMVNTHFENSNGLDTDGHLTSALDVALMSRELIIKYPQIHNYSTIWMENITHVTARGSSEFGLSNTNKLIKQYEWATGLKTGSTSLAKYCVSATALKDGVEMIAVIMAAPDFKIRFADAVTLLNYGYGKCKLYVDENSDILEPVSIKKGVKDTVGCKYEGEFRYLDMDGADFASITKEIIMNEDITAPVAKNGVAGEAIYSLNGNKIGGISILYGEDVEEAGFKHYFQRAIKGYLL